LIIPRTCCKWQQIRPKTGHEDAKKRTERRQVERTQFVAALRTALMQLNDFQSLRRSPLLPLLAGANATSPIQLQQVLLEAIEGLRQVDGLPAQRAYEILYIRYVEQIGQEEVADQLGVSVRQLRREQANALELLADLLDRRFRLFPATRLHTKESFIEKSDAAPAPPLPDELGWLRIQHGAEASDLSAEITRALDDLAGLAHCHAVDLHHEAPADLPLAAIAPLVLRQTLLALLTVAVARAEGGQIQATVHTSATHLVLTVRASGRPGAPGPVQDSRGESLQIAADLLAQFGCALQIEATFPFVGRLVLPIVQSIPVLVVDDNPDTRRLFERYADQSRFRVVTASGAQQALALVQEVRPQALILDIMMPGTDGWDLLTRLRHLPATATIPTAVCSILPQAELARFLGATTFLQKPVSQSAFLEALDRLTASAATTPG
jgi:CheY-like chemotaxis protein/transcriptional regulator with XRE-family HTH domain